MKAAEAYRAFFGQFGIPAYEEGAAPAAHGAGYPLLTYRWAEGTGDGEGVSLSASLWVSGPGWREARELAGRIGEALPPGGVFLPVEEGGLWLARDNPWITWTGDGDDPFLRRALFRLTARLYRR